MRYLIDTNIFIAMTVHRDRVAARHLGHHSHESGLSPIVLHELYAGAYESRRRERSLEIVRSIGLPLLPFDEDDARAAGEIKAQLKRRGTPLGHNDVLIAGQARRRRSSLPVRSR